MNSTQQITFNLQCCRAMYLTEFLEDQITVSGQTEINSKMKEKIRVDGKRQIQMNQRQQVLTLFSSVLLKES